MTDPGSSVPPVQATNPASAALPKGDARANVLNITGPLGNLPRAVRVDGTVAQSNRDGTVVINTDHGNITAKILSSQPVTQGQKVEVDLSPGNPPRQAIVRTAPTPVQQTGQTQAPLPSSAPSQTNTVPQQAPSDPLLNSPPPSTSQTQAPVSTPSGNTQAAPQQAQGSPPITSVPSTSYSVPPLQSGAPQTQIPQSFPLPEGQAVRLLPLPPGSEISPLPPGAIPETIQAAPAFPALPDTLPALAFFKTLTTGPILPLLQMPAGQSTAAGPVSQFFHLLAGLDAKTDMPGAFTLTIPGGRLPVLPQTLPRLESLNLRALPPLLPEGEMPDFPSLSTLPASRIDMRVQTIVPEAGHFALAQIAGSAGHKELPLIIRLPMPMAGQTTATVEGFTKQGLPVLSLQRSDTPVPEEFVLQFNASNLEPGDKISLMPLPIQPEDLTPVTTGLPVASQQGAQNWPALQQIVNTLGQAAPQAAQAMAQIMPNPAMPQQFPAAALLFIAAVRAGDLGSWLGGKSLDLLRDAGKTDLISKLTGDSGSASKPVTAGTQEWQSMPLPLYYDGQVHKSMLWYRKDGGKDKDDQGKQTRFVFDLELNRMGAVQLDGLAKHKRIDLIMRTLRPVSAPMKQIMRQKYLNALDRAEFSGELSFQDRPDQFIKVDGTAARSAFHL